MKKITILVTFIALQITSIYAQNPKMEAALGQLLGKFSTAKTDLEYINLANDFARIANAEPKEWLPQYYAAQCHVLAGYNILNKDMGKAQDFAILALSEIQAAQKLAPNESELLVLEALTYQLQLIENPMANGPMFMPMILGVLEKAEAVNPENPRIYTTRGEFTLNMPAFIGGGAENAMPDIKKAIEKFESFKPASMLHPNWGRERAERLMKQVSKG
jgi:hypothetical protein